MKFEVEWCEKSVIIRTLNNTSEYDNCVTKDQLIEILKVFIKERCK